MMEIKLPKDVEQKLIASIQRYMTENFGDDIGVLKASLFLRYCLEEIAPCAYNQAISDARAFMQERVADLENVCFAQEFGYWNKGTASRRRTVSRP
jgi:uncharacterized protein (DUF2164 family)